MTSLDNKLVLLIEDDPAMQRALTRVLTAEGTRAISAHRPDDALELLAERRERIDLIITDLRMPVMTGITVVHAARQIAPDIPVIVLTAFGSPALKAACLEEGAVSFLEKPLDTPELLAALRQALGDRSQGEGI